MSESNYVHSQSGRWLTIVLAIPMVFVLGVVIVLIRQLNSAHPPDLKVFPVMLLVLVLLGLSMALFSKLTVRVDEEQIQLAFEPGWITKSFPIREIASARRVRNNPLIGWGIRWIPGCWIFNVAGLETVEIRMKNGRHYRIGTDEPDQLLNAILAEAHLQPA